MLLVNLPKVNQSFASNAVNLRCATFDSTSVDRQGVEERAVRNRKPELLHLLARAVQTTPAIERIFEQHAGARAEARVDAMLVEALVRHGYTHHMRELERLMWIALSTSHGTFLALTPEVSAELRPVAGQEPAPAEASASAAMVSPIVSLP